MLHKTQTNKNLKKPSTAKCNERNDIITPPINEDPWQN